MAEPRRNQTFPHTELCPLKLHGLFDPGTGLASGLPSAPAGMVVMQLSLVSPRPVAVLDSPLLVSQQKTESARDAEV